jgi:hypothetical protein
MRRRSQVRHQCQLGNQASRPTLLQILLNQRNTVHWVAVQESQTLIMPTTQSAGCAARVLSTTFTASAAATFWSKPCSTGPRPLSSHSSMFRAASSGSTSLPARTASSSPRFCPAACRRDAKWLLRYICDKRDLRAPCYPFEKRLDEFEGEDSHGMDRMEALRTYKLRAGRL